MATHIAWAAISCLRYIGNSQDLRLTNVGVQFHASFVVTIRGIKDAPALFGTVGRKITTMKVKNMYKLSMHLLISVILMISSLM